MKMRPDETGPKMCVCSAAHYCVSVCLLLKTHLGATILTRQSFVRRYLSLNNLNWTAVIPKRVSALSWILGENEHHLTSFPYKEYLVLGLQCTVHHWIVTTL